MSFSTLLDWVLAEESLVDMGNDTTSSDGGLDEDIKFFVTSNGEL